MRTKGKAAIYIIVLVVFGVTMAFAQWSPEVLLHRQSDQPGPYYERIEGLGDWTGDGIDDFAVRVGGHALNIWWGGQILSFEPDTTIFGPDTLSLGPIENAGDLTADGIPELAVGCWRYLLIYRGGRGQIGLLQALRKDFTSMAIPGDISADGIPDLILGDPGWNNSRGRLLVYLGTPTGFVGPVDSLEGTGPSSSLLGYGLTSGADMDGDGWGDFACTFNSWDTTVALFHPRPGDYFGEHELFYGWSRALIPRAYQSGCPALVIYCVTGYCIHLGGTGLDTIPDAILSVPANFLGSPPSYVGDVNDDGWGDWVAGGDGAFGGLGAFLLFLGGPLISNYSYWMVGAQGQDYWAMGKGMTGVGDVNGDGIDDFAMLCSNDTTGHGGSQLVVFAGDPEWHVAVDDRRPAPVRVPVTIQAYPNPFNASTRIVIEGLRAGSPFDLSIHNILGQEVFHSQERAVTDRHTSAWQPDQSLSGGIYFCSVHTGISQQTRKLLLIR
jgi:hypothetical protein